MASESSHRIAEGKAERRRGNVTLGDERMDVAARVETGDNHLAAAFASGAHSRVSV